MIPPVRTLAAILMLILCSETCSAQTRVQSGVVDLDDGKLYYEMAGSGPVVVLIHGFTLDRRMWDAQFTTIAKDHTTIRYDLRGHGKSSGVSGEFSHVDDLAALLDGLSIDHAHLIGLSLGGWIATDFSIAFPDRVSAAVLIDPYYPLNGSFEFDSRIRNHISVARSATLATGLARWLKDPLFAPACEHHDVKTQLSEIVLKGHAALGKGAMFLNVQKDIKSRRLEGKSLADIDCRVLCLIGTRDLPRFHAVAEHFSRTISKIDVVSVPDAGHMANMENPEFVLARVTRFLDE